MATAARVRATLDHLAPPRGASQRRHRMCTPTEEVDSLGGTPWLFPASTLQEQQQQLDSAVADGVLSLQALGLTPIGAEVSGVHLQGVLPPRLSEALRAALNVHKVLVLRGQRLDHTQHVALARSFGQVTIGHVALRSPQNAVSGHPEVFALVREGVTQTAADEKLRFVKQQYLSGITPTTAVEQSFCFTPGAASKTADASPTAVTPELEIGRTEGWWLKRWHTDISGAINPPFLSLLRPERGGVPPPSAHPSTNGDTYWCNLAAAYSALPAELRALVQGRYGLHDLYELASEHPLVTVHPETQEHVRKTLHTGVHL